MSTEKILTKLDAFKRAPAADVSELSRLLRELKSIEFDDAGSLIRFHETLLFLRAYPPNNKILKQVEGMLKSFGSRISRLRHADADLSSLDEPEVSGIAGGSVTSNFSYEIVRWLNSKYPRQLAIDWDWFEEEDRFGAVMPFALPLLAEDALVEAHVPYREWVQAAKGGKSDIGWLLEQFAALNLTHKARARLYDSLKLHVTWRLGNLSSRTRMKLAPRRIFYHQERLIERIEVSLSVELNADPIEIERLTPEQGEKVLEMARETSAVRYRELHGFTHGDSQRVLKAYLGRGTEAYVLSIPPAYRLPLRAYHAALILKNGVPVGYFEGLSLFERMESGFNLYYTFREGETAWLYARILHLMRQLFGVSVFSIDPYQVGHENEEGIESGAFWFYRKLGFRPVRAELLKLARREEQRILARPKYRTTAKTLRQLASGHMLYEADSVRPADRSSRNWDRFEVRKIELAIQRRMAGEFKGNAEKMRASSLLRLKRTLHFTVSDLSDEARQLVENLAIVLAMIPNPENWSQSEKELATRIIRAKASGDEGSYLRMMQSHDRLRDGFIKLGTTNDRHP